MVSSIYTRTLCPTTPRRSNVAGALQRPNGMTSHSYNLRWVQKAVFSRLSGFIATCQKPDANPMCGTISPRPTDPARHQCMAVGMHLSRSRHLDGDSQCKKRQLPSFFLMSSTGEAQGDSLAWNLPSSSNTESCHSNWSFSSKLVLQGGCLTGLMTPVSIEWVAMSVQPTLLLAPTKQSLYLSINFTASSGWVRDSLVWYNETCIFLEVDNHEETVVIINDYLQKKWFLAKLMAYNNSKKQ